MTDTSAAPEKKSLLLNDIYGDTSQVKRIFRWFITLILFGLVGGIIIVLTTNNTISATIIALSLVPILASYYFIHTEQFEFAGTFLAVITIVLNTVLASRGLGIHHLSNLAYPATLIVASLVTRTRTMIFLTALSIGCVAWLVFGEIYGAYTPDALGQSVPGDFLSASLVILLTALMVRLISQAWFRSNLRLQGELTERKKTEENLRQREAILNAAAQSAEMLFKTPDWRKEINYMLERLGKSINASHAYLFEHYINAEGTLTGSMRAEWAAPSLPNDLDNPFYQDMPVLEPGLERWFALLEAGQPYLGDVKNATPAELEIIRARDMEAVLDVPIFVNGEWWGVIGFDEVRYQRTWTGAEVDALRIATNVLGAAIQRQLDETALQNELSRRKELIGELESKNRELEQFTYTVSHDLKSPIITVKGFLGLLEQDLSKGNQTRVHDDVTRISEAVDKMNRLLGELLELSRIGRMMNPPQTVSSGGLVKDAFETLHGRLEPGNITLQVQPNLPAVHGDRHRLVEVLQNLIENSIKFMGEQKSPLIEVGCRESENGNAIFFVRDNGIGIAPEYHERIFGLFNKLNANTEGTGIGLALVKRIVEVHGGRIWVESEEGKGATFLFSLPLPPAHSQR